jgi:hypothetical protein
MDGKGLNHDFSQFTRSIPASWIVAQKLMATMSLKLSLQIMDQSDILKGDVSISHALMCTDSHHILGNVDKPNGNTTCSLRSKGIWTLADMGEWREEEIGQLTFVTQNTITNPTWSQASK